MRAAAGVIRGGLLVLGLALAGCGVHDPAADRELPPVVIRPLEADEPALVVCMIGDMGTGSWDQEDVADAMALRAERDGWDFAVFLGDNFYPAGVESVDDEQWQTKHEEIYDAPVLQRIPFYVVLGNHDHKGNVQAQVDYSQRSERWRLPARYYAFEETLGDGTRVAFFMLDTQVMGPGNPAGEAQRAWLAEGLAASEADWKIVCGHHPVYSGAAKRGPTFRTEFGPFIEETFVAGGVDLYLSGHDHVLDLTPPIEGVRYVVSGAGAGPGKADLIDWTEHSEYAATGGGFVVLRITAEDLVIEFVRMDGETQYAATLERSAE